MTFFKARFWWMILSGGCIATACGAPTPAAKPAPPPPIRVEPGMEEAVRWKWWVVPSDEGDWRVKPPEPAQVLPEGAPGAPSPTGLTQVRPATYEVQKGDALIKIAKKFNLTVVQLKTFNEKKNDVIHIGEVLKIPTIEDLKAMPQPIPVAIPVPETPAPTKRNSKGSKGSKSSPKQTARLEHSPEYKTVQMQSFLDREQFSTGGIDGRDGAMFIKMVSLYQASHGGLTMEALTEKAHAAVPDPFTRYILSEEDFRFILPPRLNQTAAALAPKSRKSKSSKAGPPPPLTYEELVAESMLAYRTPWEFVAERYHCDESYLRRINYELKGTPGPGAEFKVPNVIPFEIEKAFSGTLQPAADPQITAAVVAVSGVTRLEISRAGALVAAMPLTMARPDLRGRGTWTILDAVPRPRLATQQELKDPPKTFTPPSTALPSAQPATPDAAAPPPPVKPPLDQEQYLSPGPNNPVGIVWINLAKGKSTQPLPYGLHGTSIPDRMGSQESLGGMRLANWDIIRAVRLLPAGTPLQWK
jgi:LysM repeat protein